MCEFLGYLSIYLLYVHIWTVKIQGKKMSILRRATSFFINQDMLRLLEITSIHWLIRRHVFCASVNTYTFKSSKTFFHTSQGARFFFSPSVKKGKKNKYAVISHFYEELPNTFFQIASVKDLMSHFNHAAEGQLGRRRFLSSVPFSRLYVPDPRVGVVGHDMEHCRRLKHNVSRKIMEIYNNGEENEKDQFLRSSTRKSTRVLKGKSLSPLSNLEEN